MGANAAAAGPGEEGLSRRAIGLPEVLFQSVTFMAPAGAVATSIALGARYGGGALPLAVILALAGCLLCASSIGQLARHLPSAGSIYTYPAESLHPVVGFLVGWGYLLVTTLVGPTTNIYFGYLLASILQPLGWPFTLTWIGFTFLCGLVIVGLNYRGVRVGAAAGMILGAFEIVVMVALAVWLVVAAGGANTLSVFTLHWSNVKGFQGLPGVAAASVYTILAFVGFEAAAPLAEETREPRRVIPIAVVLSCLAIGIFYVFTTYAADAFYGPARFEGYGQLGGGTPWIAFAQKVWGVGWIVVLAAILNSTFANGNSGAIAATRTWYAMARIRLLPPALRHTHPRYRTPWVGIALQFGLTVAIAVPLGLGLGPVSAFTLLSTMLAAVMIAIYIVFNASCLAYYARRATTEFNWLLHVAVPILGTAVMLPALLTALGVGSSFLSFVAPLPSPIDKAALVIAAWFLLGLAYLGYLLSRRRQRLSDMRQVFE